MLSRVAERLYWFGRYLERVENTARLLSVYSNVVLDLPKAGFVWGSLVDITGYVTLLMRALNHRASAML